MARMMACRGFQRSCQSCVGTAPEHRMLPLLALHLLARWGILGVWLLVATQIGKGVTRGNNSSIHSLNSCAVPAQYLWLPCWQAASTPPEVNCPALREVPQSRSGLWGQISWTALNYRRGAIRGPIQVLAKGIVLSPLLWYYFCTS